MNKEEFDLATIAYRKKKEQQQRIVKVIGGLIVVFVIALMTSIGFSSRKVEGQKLALTEPVDSLQARKQLVEKQFSAWDGSHVGLTRIIKEAMNDPDSYDHVETVYWDVGDHLIVRTTFRGNNKFGGKVKNWVKAKVDFAGNVLEIIEQGE